MIFVDTSAIYALAESGDPNHPAAVLRLQQILDSQEGMLTHNYVLLESVALLQARLGLAQAVKFADDSANFTIEWIDKSLHLYGIRQWQKSGKRHISLVDHISFLVMRRHHVKIAFAFDPDFEREGFKLFVE